MTVKLIPPRFLKLFLPGLAVGWAIIPTVITYAFIKTLLAPGDPPIHLYILCAVWCAVVGWAFFALFSVVSSIMKATTKLEIDFSNGWLNANNKRIPIDSSLLRLDASPPNVRIMAGGKKYFVTKKWSGFDQAVECLQKQNMSPN